MKQLGIKKSVVLFHAQMDQKKNPIKLLLSFFRTIFFFT